jgi:hypothetical protein
LMSVASPFVFTTHSSTTSPEIFARIASVV